MAPPGGVVGAGPVARRSITHVLGVPLGGAGTGTGTETKLGGRPVDFARQTHKHTNT